MIQSLHEVRANLETDLAETFSADIAGMIAAAFVDAVVCRRREIESKTSRELN